MNIYLVTAFGGQWEDSWERPIKAFKTPEKAVEFVEKREKGDREWLDKADRIVDEFADKNYRVIDIRMAEDYVASGYHINQIELEE